jgi:hypothetical protein
LKNTILIALFALTTLTATHAQKGNSKRAFLESKVPEAARQCKVTITATAKDPATLEFAPTYEYGFGSALTRNWVFIDWNVRGKNTYGALLLHRVECSVSCNQKTDSCSFVGMSEPGL